MAIAADGTQIQRQAATIDKGREFHPVLFLLPILNKA
jgi:hypothetical protein